MTIYADSRYADAEVFRAEVPKLNGKSVVVKRSFPVAGSRFYLYRMGAGERIEQTAHRTLGDASLWYVIMDFNPEIINPFNIPIGTLIRIPYDQ